jgi:hypothetical protein
MANLLGLKAWQIFAILPVCAGRHLIINCGFSAGLSGHSPIFPSQKLANSRRNRPGS